MENRIQITDWKLTNLSTGKTVPAHIPGDITDDLYRVGEIAEPYYGENYKQLGWIAETDFEYEGRFVLSEQTVRCEDISLILKGVDTFAEVFANDVPLCKTENMFVEYALPVKSLVRQGSNTLRVRMHSTKRVMESIDTTGYFGVFNVPRLFARKAQCHFGWDWAPDLCGYGIWQPVYVACRRKHRIGSVNYWASTDGDVTIFTELNYCINATTDDYGVAIDGTAEQRLDDTLVCKVLSPDGSLAAQCTIPVEGRKNFCNLRVEAPQLWWPNGYGAQPLYRYEVTLYRAGEAVSETAGTLAFRKVELAQKPTGMDTLGFTLRINDTDIFVRGSNWVPVDCFTGAIRDEKYERLLLLAKNGNCNLLRVWGGGIYERDLFYDLCDREGILVWQDFMFACGDIPEDKPEWVENTLHECEQQIKRLRVHPSVVYWCGGNEKTGSFALQISRGDKFVDYTLHGLVRTFDQTRPYVRQSPFSYSDVGNNWRSGETHCNGNAGCSIVQRTQRMRFAGKYGSFLMLLAMAVSVLFCLAACLKSGKAAYSGLRRAWPYPMAAGVSNAALNLLVIVLAGSSLSPGLIYPVIAVGGLTITTLCSALLFREKLQGRQWLGVAIGVVAVVLLSI